MLFTVALYPRPKLANRTKIATHANRFKISSYKHGEKQWQGFFAICQKVNIDISILPVIIEPLKLPVGFISKWLSTLDMRPVLE